MADTTKREIKFIVYLDDDGTTKEKYALLKEDEFWIEIQLYDIKLKQEYHTPSFKIPKTRVLKIKNYEGDTNE